MDEKKTEEVALATDQPRAWEGADGSCFKGVPRTVMSWDERLLMNLWAIAEEFDDDDD